MHYVKSDQHKVCCADDSKKNSDVVHSIASDFQKDAIDLIRWVLSVAKLPADSPRFKQYVSRWDVPSKIKAAKLDGSFHESTKNCAPIDPAWVRFVPAALEEWRAYYEKFLQPKRPSSSSRQPVTVKLAKSIAA